MTFFEQKTKAAAETRAVSLEAASEAALLLVLAFLAPQREMFDLHLAPISEPIATALRAELARRWARRGAPAAIELPVRLPALGIQSGVTVFRMMAAQFRAIEEAGARAGETIRPVTEQAAGARTIAEQILAAVLDCRLEPMNQPTA